MADFMDREAQESDEDDNGSDKDVSAAKRKRNALDSSDDEEDEEDVEKHQEVMKDFLNDDEDSGSEDERRKKRKKKKRRRSASGSGSSRSGSRSRSRSGRSDDGSDLDDEDMDLIEENLGVKIKKKRSRIQMDSSDDDAGSGGHSSEDDLPDPERRTGRSSAMSREGSDEDIGNFIVDEEGRPIERKKAKKKHIFEDSQRQLAEDIFGVAFDYDEFEQYDEKSESDQSDDYEDEDEEKIRRKEKRKKKSTKTIFDIFDPHDLALGHYTDLDDEIRRTDVPERMQLRQVKVTAVAEDSDELDREADWIYKHGFTTATLTKQADYSKDDCEEWRNKPATVEKIKKVILISSSINSN